MPHPPNLKFLTCDDWFIFAVDGRGLAWFVNTELWPAWSRFGGEADREINAVAKYMLPIAFSHWNNLPWKPVEGDHGERLGMRIYTAPPPTTRGTPSPLRGTSLFEE